MRNKVIISMALAVSLTTSVHAQSILVSTDGRLELIVPAENNLLTVEQTNQNESVFASMEKQVLDGPVVAGFGGSIPGSFMDWMLATHGYELVAYWGKGDGDIAGTTDSYFLDRKPTNTFVIDVQSNDSSAPSTLILVMTYQYFLATR